MLGTQGSGGGGPGLPPQVFPLISQKHLQFGTQPPHAGMSHFWKGGREAKCKNQWSHLLESEMGVQRERGHPVLHVGLRSLSSPGTDSSPRDSTDGADRGQ